MFSNHFTTNFSQNAPVKKNWKSVNIWQRYGHNFVAYFLGHANATYNCFYYHKEKQQD